MDDQEFKERMSRAQKSLRDVAEEKERLVGGRMGTYVPSGIFHTAIDQISELAVVVSKVEGKQNTDARDLKFSLQRDVVDLIETLHRLATKKEPTTTRR